MSKWKANNISRKQGFFFLEWENNKSAIMNHEYKLSGDPRNKNDPNMNK
jgi:hypothetical protein